MEWNRIVPPSGKFSAKLPNNNKPFPWTIERTKKLRYHFHEAIINTLRPVLKEGIRSVIVSSPPRTSYGQEFLGHIKGHHTWLLQGTNKATFSQITASASTSAQVSALTKTDVFKQLIQENAAEETENLLEILEKRLSRTDNLVYFSLQEAEGLILFPQPLGKPQPEYLMLTNNYLSASRQRNRVNRLMQVAARNGVKTRVIEADSNAGKRLTQLGGLVALATKEST